MAEEIGELDLTAQANAAQTATNYISADSTGIRIANSNPSTATTYQHQTATETEFVVEGVSRAEISGDGARFGKEYVEGATDNESYMELDYHSLQMIDKSRNTYFYVSDLRDSSGQATINERHVADGTATNYTLACNATDTNYTVSVSDGSGGTITKESYRVVFSTAPTDGAIITVVYNTRDGKAKAFTFGQRTSNGIIGPLSFSEGYYTESSGFCSHSEGIASVANNEYAHAEGNETRASGIESHSEGYKTTASGVCSHSEGSNTTASGDISHAEGANTTASGKHSHAEGTRTTASGYPSHAEGEDTTASGNNSHAEGDGTTASETCAHAEGYSTTASGQYSHAEGSSTVASGSYSHAEGCGPTTASGIYSHAQNLGTIAAKFAQTTIGMYNVEDTSTTGVHPSGYQTAGKYALIVGNGTGAGARSNALAVNWNGTIESGIAGYGATTWIDILKGNAALYVPKDPDAMSNPVGALVMETAGGGAWVLSNYNDEGFRLVYITAENRAAGTNTTTMPVKINTDGSIVTSRDINTTSVSGVFTAGSGITVAVFKFCQRGNVAAFYIGVSKSTATAANTVITVGTIAAGRRPPFECAGPGTNGIGDAYINENGVVSFRSTSQIAANARFYVRVTYPVV